MRIKPYRYNQNNYKMELKITIGAKSNIFKTIGHTNDFKPVLWYKIGERKQAIEDLTNFYCKFQEFLATGVELTDNEYNKFSKQFEDKAKIKAIEKIAYIEDNEVMYKDKFFSFL